MIDKFTVLFKNKTIIININSNKTIANIIININIKLDFFKKSKIVNVFK